MELLSLLFSVTVVLAILWFLIKAMAWSPILLQGLNAIRQDKQKDVMTRNIATVLWVLAGIWYVISALVFFFTGLWAIAGLLTSARDWWHTPK